MEMFENGFGRCGVKFCLMEFFSKKWFKGIFLQSIKMLFPKCVDCYIQNQFWKNQIFGARTMPVVY